MNFEIDFEALRALQLVELEILIEFDRICKRHNIPYQLFGGTLLGAIRYQGFIPWDDDVDICMLRKDYNSFLKVCKKDLDKSFFLQTHETDKEYIHPFARIRKNNTLALQKNYADIEMHHGIFIDIFPMDNIKKSSIKGKIQINTVNTIRKIKLMKVKKFRLNSSNLISKTIRMLIYFLFKPVSMKKFNKLETKIMTFFNDTDTIYSTSLTTGDQKVQWACIAKNERFYDTENRNFEGYQLPIPRNYDEILTNLYGEYMLEPAKEEQKPHHGIIKLSF